MKLFSRVNKFAAGRINAADASSSSPKGCVLYFGQKCGEMGELGHLGIHTLGLNLVVFLS